MLLLLKLVLHYMLTKGDLNKNLNDNKKTQQQKKENASKCDRTQMMTTQNNMQLRV